MSSHLEREYIDGENELFGKIILTPEQQALRDGIHKIEQDVAHREKHLNYSPEENSDFVQQKLEKVIEDHYVQNQLSREEVEGKVEKLKKAYVEEQKRHTAENALEFQRWQTRYRALDKEGAKAEAERYVKSEGDDWSLDRLEILNARLAELKIPKVDHAETYVEEGAEGARHVQSKPFSEWIQLKGAEDPAWLKDQPALKKALQLYGSEYGRTTFMYENGELEPNMDIRKMYMGKR